MVRKIHVGIDPGGVRHGFAYRLPDGRYHLSTIRHQVTRSFDEFTQAMNAEPAILELLARSRSICLRNPEDSLTLECHIEVNIQSRQGAWHDYLWQKWVETVLPNLCLVPQTAVNCHVVSPETWHLRLLGHHLHAKSGTKWYLEGLGVIDTGNKDSRDALCVALHGYLSETGLYHHGIAMIKQAPPGLGQILNHTHKLARKT